MAMQRAIVPLTATARLSVVAIAAVILMALSALGISGLSAIVKDAIEVSSRAIAAGYAGAPALMLGMAALAMLPLVTLIRPAVRTLSRASDATRRISASARFPNDAEISGDSGKESASAFLEVVGGSNARFAIVRDMLRIGREDDNDIRIPSTTVHRYHAAIYREHRDIWHIADLSGTDGNGIRVNGQCCSDARLADGDVIELGPGRLRFRAGLR